MSASEPIKPQTPISPDSRLLAKRNLDVKGRVREDIKLKSLRETELIKKRTKEANIHAKSKILDELNSKLLTVHEIREGRLMSWVKKTENSPYRLDQNEVDLIALQRNRERTKTKKFYKDRKKLVKSMDGTPNMEFYTDELKKSLTVEETLAMEHLRLLKTINKLKYEQNKLTELVHHDCDETETKFARIALYRSQRKAMERSGSLASLDGGSLGESFYGGGGLSKSNSSILNRSRSRGYKKIDNTVYSADGRWNESGQFVVARSEKDKVGLMSAKYARASGDTAPTLAQRRTTEIFQAEVG